MTPSPLPTRFAPAERAAPETILRQHQDFLDCKCARMIDALPGFVLVLNAFRQTVFANTALLGFLGHEAFGPVLGRRPGELLSCVNALRPEDCGCGSTEFCRTCGAVESILKGLSGTANIQECRMTRLVGSHSEALDLRVSSVPFELEGQSYVVFSAADASHEKRRTALEHIFFHDILNMAGGLRELSGMIDDEAPENLKPVTEVVRDTSARIVEDILVQRDLAQAENNELAPSFGPVHTLEALNSTRRIFERQKLAQGKAIALDPKAAQMTIETDAKLLHRVLGNLVKNALEACETGQTVTLGCEKEDGRVEFWVHNPGAMPREVQLQVFNRSFSTKGPGRGLGTYSVKLLTERYLKGAAGFSSDESSGTRFRVSLPIEPAAKG